MEELHSQASQQIFESRNATHPDVLDLHGLHIVPSSFSSSSALSCVSHTVKLEQDEALEILETFLSKQERELVEGSTASKTHGKPPSGSNGGSAAKGFKLVYVITGTGHHSQNKKARLLPAVQKFLTERGYIYVDTSADGRGGMLTITIKPNI